MRGLEAGGPNDSTNKLSAKRLHYRFFNFMKTDGLH